MLDPIGLGKGLAGDLFKPLMGVGENLFNFADKIMGFFPKPQLPGLDFLQKVPNLKLPQFKPLPFNPMPLPLSMGSGNQTIDKLMNSVGGAEGNLNNMIQGALKDGKLSQKEMLQIQQAQEQFQQMMTLLTNMMKMLHDINMSIIQNMR